MPISPNLRGIFFMCLSMVGFTVNDTFMKAVTQTLPLFQAIALRGALAILGLTLVAWGSGAFRHRIGGKDGMLILIRSVADMAATYLFLTALLHMPLAPEIENLAKEHQLFVAGRSMRDVEPNVILKVRDPNGLPVANADDL